MISVCITSKISMGLLPRIGDVVLFFNLLTTGAHKTCKETVIFSDVRCVDRVYLVRYTHAMKFIIIIPADTN